MPLPELPEAITARVVPVGYTHIALLLYGDTDVAHTKRISSWRRTDPDFPPALSAGRSPTFDAKGVWQWLARKARSGDGRTQSSLRDMTQLQPNVPGATTMRHWLLAGLAMHHQTGSVGTRQYMTSLAALAAVAKGKGGHNLGMSRPLPDAVVAQRLLSVAGDDHVMQVDFVQTLVAELPRRPAFDQGAPTPNPFAALADDTVADDLRGLAARAIDAAPAGQVALMAQLALVGDDGSLSAQLDATSTSPEATQFIVGLIDGVAERLGRTWTTVYDPAAGEGHLLSALAMRREGRRWTLYGQDADAESLQLAAARLLTTDVGFDVRLTDDTIEHDQFRDLRADVVVADPPQPTRRLRTHDHMDDWWQHVMSKMADEQSMAFVLTSDQVQAQPSDDEIASGHVLAIIETGQRLRRDTPGHSVLWVLTPQRVNRTVRVAVTEKLADWLSPLLDVACSAVTAAMTGLTPPQATEAGIQVWSCLATDADVLRPMGEESWPMQSLATDDAFDAIEQWGLRVPSEVTRLAHQARLLDEFIGQDDLSLTTVPVAVLRRHLVARLEALPEAEREQELAVLMQALAQVGASHGNTRLN